MATKFLLPMLGQTMEEGTILKWFKNEGDQVAKGEALLEVMTDKVNMEVESPETGVLRKILVAVDEVVPILAPIAIIGTADEPIEDLLDGGNGAVETAQPIMETAQPVSAAAAAIVTETAVLPGEKVLISPRARKLARENGIAIDQLAGIGSGPLGRVIEKDVEAYIADSSKSATPLAARVAADKGVDLKDITGTGVRGKITRDDVLQAAAPATAPAASMEEVKVIPFSGIRKLVADNVAKSAQTAPHVTLTAEIDMTEAVKVRAQIIDQFEKKYGLRVTFTHFIVKAAAMALVEHPIVNSSLQGNEIRLNNHVNMGMAVPLEGGLIVPVLHNAESKSIAQIAIEFKELINKAKTGTLAPNEISGGTFSISNLGAYGIDVFNPIITPGQSAILGVCRIVEKPAVVNGQLEIRSMMNLCLSFDHRVMDGAPAAQFLKTVRDLLESPYQLMI